MMFDKRKFLKIIGLLILIVTIFLLLYFLFFKKDEKVDNNILKKIEKIIPKKQPEKQPEKKDDSKSDVKEEKNTEVSLKAIIIFSAERFGSYSSDSQPYSNLKDIEYLMSYRMKSLVKKMRASSDNSTKKDYYGVSTKVLSYTMDKDNFETKKKIEVIVSCQREESFGRMNVETKLKYQKLKMVFYKINNKWLLDDAQWL